MQNSPGRSVHIVVIILKKIGFLIKFKRIKKSSCLLLTYRLPYSCDITPECSFPVQLQLYKKAHKNSRPYILYAAKK